MRLMVIGGGGREYYIAKRLAKDPRVTALFVLPGNGGMREFASCVDIKATDIEGIKAFAVNEKIDFAVVTPDDPLALGAVDVLEAAGIRCFGPAASAARIEASKSFAKALMQKYGIPTAQSRCFEDMEEALAYAAGCPLPTVIKADGLALGKGVFICRTREEAAEAVRELLSGARCGESGKRILIEEFLEGLEVTMLSLTDGRTLVPLVSSMDHKTIGEGGVGPNTGGMGVIAPNPFYTEDIARECMERIFLPTVRAMEAEGCPFSGCLYFGLMLTAAGPKVIEYNCRFGDPECQTVLPLLKTDLLDAFLAVREGRLSELPIEFEDKAVCCVVLASGGYPGSYRKGLHINIDPAAFDGAELSVVHAGTRLTSAGYATAGGRVINVVAKAQRLEDAVAMAYNGAEKVKFEGAYYRKDIGASAIRNS